MTVPTMASTTLRAGTMSSRTGRPTRSARATTSESSRRSYGVGVALAGPLVADVDVEQPHGHDDDVAIAGRLKRGDHVRERVRIADRHQHVAGTDVDLVERKLRRRCSRSNVSSSIGCRRARLVRAGHDEPHRQGRDERAAAMDATSPVASIASSADGSDEARPDEPHRQLAAPSREGSTALLNGIASRARAPKSNEGGNREHAA